MGGHVARTEEMRNADNILVGKSEENSEDLGVDRKIILELILWK